MAKNGILISGSRESGVPAGKYVQWARVSIGTKEEMDMFLNILSNLTKKA